MKYKYYDEKGKYLCRRYNIMNIITVWSILVIENAMRVGDNRSKYIKIESYNFYAFIGVM